MYPITRCLLALVPLAFLPGSPASALSVAVEGVSSVQVESEEGEFPLKKTVPLAGKGQPVQLIVEQVPHWNNWQPVPNLGPVNLADAPVFLRKGEGDYWVFGRYGGKRKKKGQKPASFTAEPATLAGFDIPLWTTRYPDQFDAEGGRQPGLGGYHAWQSKDMHHWVHHGPVTEGFSKWVTTAELVDGALYIYYDFPNDQDPHLYIDDNWFDGKPGKDKGLAFADPSDGSDCAVIRDHAGRFHVIYEDWSPIDANKRSWDSPLAGHAVSDTGLRGFTILDPVVDHRTTPTGETKTYNHPHWAKEHPDWDSNVATYQVHEPEQPAYGDWAGIGIGDRYWLFGDHDPAGGHQMSVGIFTAPSIDGPFTLVHQVGQGHPDPDIGFAESRFYLFTQQKTDWVSTGPWSGKVEARGGVDVDGDGSVDQWTGWQAIAERYEAHPERAKLVIRHPAALDVSGLPAGKALSYELRVSGDSKGEPAPAIQRVTVEYRP